MKQKLSIAITIIFIASFAFFAYANDTFNKDVFNDSDQDGLSDAEEQLYGTNPHNKDTDEDGYSDGTEIKSGYDPLKAAPEDKILTPTTIQPSASNTTESSLNAQNLTKNFDLKLQAFLTENGEKDISMSSLDSFVEENIGTLIESSQQNYILTEDDIAKIKVKKQTCQQLTESECIQQKNESAKIYLVELLDIFIGNIPAEIKTPDDVFGFYDDLMLKIEKLGSDNPNYEYFRTIGSKLEIVQDQLQVLEVPEDLLSMHIKLLEIIRGFLSLRDPALPSIEDPLGKLIILSKANTLGNATADLANEFAKKITQLQL